DDELLLRGEAGCDATVAAAAAAPPRRGIAARGRDRGRVSAAGDGGPCATEPWQSRAVVHAEPDIPASERERRRTGAATAGACDEGKREGSDHLSVLRIADLERRQPAFRDGAFQRCALRALRA